jgi:hypothetical protein
VNFSVEILASVSLGVHYSRANYSIELVALVSLGIHYSIVNCSIEIVGNNTSHRLAPFGKASQLTSCKLVFVVLLFGCTCSCHCLTVWIELLCCDSMNKGWCSMVCVHYGIKH